MYLLFPLTYILFAFPGLSTNFPTFPDTTSRRITKTTSTGNFIAKCLSYCDCVSSIENGS